MHRPLRPASAGLALSLALAFVAGCAGTSSAPVDPGSAAASRRLEAHLHFLASDAMGGRDTATVHDGVTAEYVASVFRGAGLEPAGDEGGYLAHYPLVASRMDLEALSVGYVDAGGARHELVAFDDFGLRGVGNGLDVDGGLVFGGHGIVAPEHGVDDLGGLGLEGRWLVVLAGAPEDADELGRPANWRGKREAARDAGALGLVLVREAPGEDDEDPEVAGRFMRFVHRAMRRRSFQLPDETSDPPLPLLFLEDGPARRLLAAGGLDLDVERERRLTEAGVGGAPLADVRLAVSAPVEIEELASANVAGLLPGRDPVLSDEVLVVSAHMDHVGTDEEGAIFNGADDNGTGTTVLLTAAERLAQGPAPRRSVLFLAVSGEEKGLLGSEWWVAHPTVPLDRVVANINIDMVGRNDPGEIGVTPSPEHPAHNTLVTRAVALGPQVGLRVGWDAGSGRFRRRVDSYYHRSDHANFSEHGIPVAFFFAGEHEDYHRPTDTIEKVDLGKVGRVADLVTRLLRDVGDAPEPPRALAGDGDGHGDDEGDGAGDDER